MTQFSLVFKATEIFFVQFLKCMLVLEHDYVIYNLILHARRKIDACMYLHVTCMMHASYMR